MTAGEQAVPKAALGALSVAGAVILLSLQAIDAAAAYGPAARPDVARHVHVAQVTVTSGGPSPRTGDVTASGRYVERVKWIADPNGRRLAVYPTDYARHDAPSTEWPLAWAEVVSREPEVDHRRLRDQFRCHAEFTTIVEPDKPSWNLELWRPDVGYLDTVVARCNP